MPIAPYLDNFANLSGWTAISMSVAAGNVGAAVDNVAGTITRDWDAVGNTTVIRFGINFTIDTSTGASRLIFIGTSEATLLFGAGCFLIQGVGITAGVLNSGGFSSAGATPAIAWASLVNGATYHVEMSLDTVSSIVRIRVYDPANPITLLGESGCSANSGFFTSTKILCRSNTTGNKFSALVYDPSMAGSPTTGPNLLSIVRWDDSTGSSHYYPGGGHITDLGIYCHAAGELPGNLELTTLSTVKNLTNLFLAAGYGLIAPSGGASGDQAWGNDASATNYNTTIALARTLVGNASAPIHGLSRSMGGLAGGRLIGQENLTNVKSWYWRVVCYDNAYLEQNIFQANIDTAWNISPHPASYAAAQALLVTGDTHQLLALYSSKFRGIKLFIDRSTADAVVPDTQNSLQFTLDLTSQGIAYLTSVSTDAHGDPITLANAQAHMAQINSSARGNLIKKGINNFDPSSSTLGNLIRSGIHN